MGQRSIFLPAGEVKQSFAVLLGSEFIKVGKLAGILQVLRSPKFGAVSPR